MVENLTSPASAQWRGPVLPLFAGLILVLAVLAVHGGLMVVLIDALAELKAQPPLPERVQVRYVREMALVPPAALVQRPATRAPIGPATPRPSSSRRKEQPPATGGAAGALATSDAAPPAEPAASSLQVAVAESASSRIVAVEQPAETPAASQAAVPVAASAPASSPAAVDNVWPQTTRVRYSAKAYFQGDVYGDAAVEWVRQGNRYQMHMDVTLGLGLFSRKVTSQGRIAAQGVLPERYDETTKMPFRNTRRSVVILGEDWVELAQGQRTARLAGLQDTASQFVQLTYLFTTQPKLAVAGQRIEFPLVFPRAVRAYAYQVQGRELLQTPIGQLDTLHVIPRRVEVKDKDFVVQAWFAPALNYLPARIRITQGDEIYIDLLIAAPPQLAAN